MERVVDLDEYRTPGGRVFSGRDRGEMVRKAARLDELDLEDSTIRVVVPDDVFSVNSSFFLEMFGPSIRRLGEEEFRRRYQFEGPNLDRVMRDGIREALLKISPLSV